MGLQVRASKANRSTESKASELMGLRDFRRRSFRLDLAKSLRRHLPKP